MIPLGGTAIWIGLSLVVILVCFQLAWFDGRGTIGNRTWSVVWLGASRGEILGRVALGLLAALIAGFNSNLCSSSCTLWVTLTSLVVYLLAIVGWPQSALKFSCVYVVAGILWGGAFRMRWGAPATLFHLFFFLASLALAFRHLNTRVTGLQSSATLQDLSERSQRALKAMRTTPAPQPQSATYNRPRAVDITPAPTRNQVSAAAVAANGLYLLTLVIEGGAALVRSAIYFVVSVVVLSPFYLLLFMATRNSYFVPVLNFLGGDTGQLTNDYMRWFTANLSICFLISSVVGLGLGCWPLLRSLFHIVFPYTRSGAGEHERDALGAREPTRGEHQKIIDTLVYIQSAVDGTARMPKIAAPSTWLVIDAPTPDAYTIGSTVYVSRAAIEDEHFAGIVAHELGHLAHKDGDLILALRRFVIPLAYFVGVDRQPSPAGAVLTRGNGIAIDVVRNEDEKIFYRFKALEIKLMLAFWCGGLGMFFLGQEWARFWRSRDFLADDYAVRLGQADSLMGILRTYQHVDVAQPFLLSNRPYTAERLDRLQG